MCSASRCISRKTACTWPAGVAVAVVILAAGGCSSATTSVAVPVAGSGSTFVSVAPGAHNAADVTFAEQMIIHHRQAVAMAGLAASRAHSHKVKILAATIKADQRPEINRMSAWLRAWRQQVPAPTASGMPGMHHPMPGLMSRDEMAKMMAASGPAFDRLFLTMMIRHHEGAVRMAKTERLQGEYAPARAMAQSIIASQTAQIAQMKTLLGQHHGYMTH